MPIFDRYSDFSKSFIHWPPDLPLNSRSAEKNYLINVHADHLNTLCTLCVQEKKKYSWKTKIFDRFSEFSQYFPPRDSWFAEKCFKIYSHFSLIFWITDFWFWQYNILFGQFVGFSRSPHSIVDGNFSERWLEVYI